MKTAEEVTRLIENRIDTLVQSLQTEMRIKKWRPEFQAIVWEALAHKALALAKTAQAEVEP
jgi:hypothetical protein